MSDIGSITYDDVIVVNPVASGNIFSEPAAGFMCNFAGTIQIITARKSNRTLTVNAGVIYPIAILSVLSGGTTATGIFAMIDQRTYKGTPA